MIRYSWQLCITSRLHPCIFTKYSTSRKMWQLIPILIARVSARTTALHSACVAGQRAHRVSWRLISSVCWRHAGSPTAQPLFDCGSCVTTYSSTQTSLKSSFLALHLSSGRLLISAKSRSRAAGCAEAEVTWHNNLLGPTIWLSRQGGSEGVQLPYMRPASRAYSANRRLGSDSSMQYCQFQVGLL